MDIHKKAEIINSRYNLAKKELLKICQNKSISLLDRWKIANSNEWAFKTEEWSIDYWLDEHTRCGDLSCQFDFNRYEKVNLFDLLDVEFTQEECKLKGLDFIESRTWKDVSLVKELILQKGVCAFINDW